MLVRWLSEIRRTIIITHSALNPLQDFLKGLSICGVTTRIYLFYLRSIVEPFVNFFVYKVRNLLGKGIVISVDLIT